MFERVLNAPLTYFEEQRNNLNDCILSEFFLFVLDTKFHKKFHKKFDKRHEKFHKIKNKSNNSNNKKKWNYTF